MQATAPSATDMKTAIVLVALFGACLGQVLPLRFSQPTYRVAQPVYHVAQPVYHVAQPALRVAQPVLKVADPRKPVAILSQSSALSEDGSFSYGFQSEDGIQASASGSVKVLSPEETAQVVQGSFSYTAPDGTPITRTYVADENGFHVEGADLPTPPPIPEAIARSLELLPQLEQQEQLAKKA